MFAEIEDETGTAQIAAGFVLADEDFVTLFKNGSVQRISLLAVREGIYCGIRRASECKFEAGDERAVRQLLLDEPEAYARVQEVKPVESIRLEHAIMLAQHIGLPEQEENIIAFLEKTEQFLLIITLVPAPDFVPSAANRSRPSGPTH